MRERDTSQLVQLVLEHLDTSVRAIYLFGSLASGEANIGSDIDLAVLLDKKADPVTLWTAAQRIASIVNRGVDVVDLLSASTVMQYEILTSGKLLYCSDQDSCNSFDNQVMTAYLDLTEQRAEILDDIRQRKRVLP